jgi:alpha-methylacyl-CoA racemase
MTGWGQVGPLAGTAGHDIDYITRSGALHAIGRAGGPPQVPLNVISDFAGGGSSLLATQHTLYAEGTCRDERGVNLLDSGAPYYDVYETADGK